MLFSAPILHYIELYRAADKWANEMNFGMDHAHMLLALPICFATPHKIYTWEDSTTSQQRSAAHVYNTLALYIVYAEVCGQQGSCSKPHSAKPSREKEHHLMYVI